MYPDKIGKFISELRKEKNLTQEMLAEKLNIGRTTISKWERGISVPDISLLEPICDFFGITISELLKGAKRNSQLDEVKQTVAAIDFYSKISKSRIVKFCFVVCISIILFFCSSLIVQQKYSYDVYLLKSSDNNFSLDGLIVSNDYRQILYINELIYNDDFIGTSMEVKVDRAHVSILSDGISIFDYEFVGEDSVLLNEMMDNIRIKIDSDDIDHSFDKNKLTFLIDYSNKDFQSEQLYFDIYLIKNS